MVSSLFQRRLIQGRPEHDGWLPYIHIFSWDWHNSVLAPCLQQNLQKHQKTQTHPYTQDRQNFPYLLQCYNWGGGVCLGSCRCWIQCPAVYILGKREVNGIFWCGRKLSWNWNSSPTVVLPTAPAPRPWASAQGTCPCHTQNDYILLLNPMTQKFGCFRVIFGAALQLLCLMYPVSLSQKDRYRNKIR